MRTSNEDRTIQWLCDQYERGNISFKHKLQRPVGQWNKKMKSLLVHSLFIGIPIDDVYVEEKDGVAYVIDGVQRISESINFVNNKYALSDITPPIYLQFVEDGKPVKKRYDIAGKRFNKLEEEVQKAFLACSFSVCYLIEYTPEEVKEMFKRKNTSKPLNAKLMRVCIESDKFSDTVYDLANHPFMDKVITVAQKKNGSDRDAIRQTFMLMMSDDKQSFTSFRSNDIDNFVIEHSEDAIKFAGDLESVLNSLHKAFEDVETIKLPITSIPMILWSGYKVQKNKYSFSKFVEVVKKFIDEHDTNEEYKEFVKSGTGNQPNVEGRLNWWKNAIK